MTRVCPAETAGVCPVDDQEGHLCCLGLGHPIGLHDHVCECGVSW